MRHFAPIVLFIYKRPAHLEATLKSLLRCEGFADSKVIVFADGPKGQQDLIDVTAARQIAQEQLGLRAEYCFYDTNRGLAASIINGIDNVIGRFGRAIIVEDDLEVAPNFLLYMNAALDRYEERAEVFQIAAHMFDAPEFRVRTSALFLPFTTTWGWATWRRAWDRFDPSAVGWEALLSDRALRTRFNLGGAYNYSAMLERQMAGVEDSWGIRWYWSVFRSGGVACFPPISFVRNTGLDGSGTHGRGAFRHFRRSVDSLENRMIGLPDAVSVDPGDVAAVRRAIWQDNGGWIGASADRMRYQFRQFPRRFTR